MKTFTVPYVIGNQFGWWAGIDIYNTSNSEVSITINIDDHETGNKL